MCKVRIENIPLHVEQGPKKKVTKLAIPESVNKARKWKFKILQASDFELMAVDYEYTQLIYRLSGFIWIHATDTTGFRLLLTKKTCIKTSLTYFVFTWDSELELHTRMTMTTTSKNSRFNARASRFLVHCTLTQGHSTAIFGKISVRKTISELEFSEHLL